MEPNLMVRLTAIAIAAAIILIPAGLIYKLPDMWGDDSENRGREEAKPSITEYSLTEENKTENKTECLGVISDDPCNVRELVGKKLIIHYWGTNSDGTYSNLYDLEEVEVLAVSFTGGSVKFRITKYSTPEWWQSIKFKRNIVDESK